MQSSKRRDKSIVCPVFFHFSSRTEYVPLLSIVLHILAASLQSFFAHSLFCLFLYAVFSLSLSVSASSCCFLLAIASPMPSKYPLSNSDIPLLIAVVIVSIIFFSLSDIPFTSFFLLYIYRQSINIFFNPAFQICGSGSFKHRFSKKERRTCPILPPEFVGVAV